MRTFLNILVIILGALIAVGPLWLFPVCDHMMQTAAGMMVPMKCHWTAMASLGCGGLMAACGILFLLFHGESVRQAGVRLGLALMLAGLAVLELLFPSVLIGVCPGEKMPCHMLTAPVLTALCALTILAAAALSLQAANALRKRNCPAAREPERPNPAQPKQTAQTQQPAQPEKADVQPSLSLPDKRDGIRDHMSSWTIIHGNLRQKPLRTAIMTIIVALFCMTLYGGTMIGQKAGIAANIVSERLGADILFVPYGYSGKVQSSLLRGEPSSFYMDRQLANDLRGEPGVGKVTAQLFIATFRAACCSLPIQMIGFDPETDFVVKPWMLSVLDRPLETGDIVIGYKIQAKVGETLQFLGQDFKVVARLGQTGMGFDTSVFMNIDHARNLLLASELGPLLNIPEGLDRQTFVSSVLVKAKPGVNTKNLVNGLSEKYAIPYNLDFVAVAEMVTDIGEKLLVFADFFNIFAVILWILAVIVLALVFSAAIQERKKEFGVLRTIGASRSALTRLIVVESLLVSGLGAVTGVIAAACLLGLLNTFIDFTLEIPPAGMNLTDMLKTGLCVLIPGILAGPLASLPAIRRLGKLDAYLILREEA